MSHQPSSDQRHPGEPYTGSDERDLGGIGALVSWSGQHYVPKQLYGAGLRRASGVRGDVRVRRRRLAIPGLGADHGTACVPGSQDRSCSVRVRRPIYAWCFPWTHFLSLVHTTDCTGVFRKRKCDWDDFVTKSTCPAHPRTVEATEDQYKRNNGHGGA